MGTSQRRAKALKWFLVILLALAMTALVCGNVWAGMSWAG